MKKLMLSLAAIGGLLTGCVAVPVSDAGVHVTGTVRSDGGAYPHRQAHGHGHGRHRDWDRDRDGIPNRHDRRPNNPNRY
ncbi:hypothetical protein [Noviherbaspirillum sp.]|uniref:hypothetical protein n=1 Tax=Noviherbaspirillum sp. TaxID=1926288 RepID=UPI002FE0775F